MRAIAWKAQLRLTKRFAALLARGVQPNKACVAVARELAGFVWAIGTAASPRAANCSTERASCMTEIDPVMRHEQR